VLVGRFELHAGQHAGFGVLAWAVPLVLTPYVLWTWTDPRAHLADELGAVALLAASVTLSVYEPSPRWQALGVGLVVIVVEWRIVSRWRASLQYRDDLAATAAELAEAKLGRYVAETDAKKAAARAAAQLEELAARVAAAEAKAVEVAARQSTPPPPPPVDPALPAGGGWRDGAPWGTSFDDHVAWLREELAAGHGFTGVGVQDLFGLGSRKAGADRLAEARRPHLVREAGTA
jgi:uncharacterized coiled-coil protein SlyX